MQRHIVEIVVKEGPDRVNEVIDWGAKFDKDPDGDYKLGKGAAIALFAYCTIKI